MEGSPHSNRPALTSTSHLGAQISHLAMSKEVNQRNRGAAHGWHKAERKSRFATAATAQLAGSEAESKTKLMANREGRAESISII